MPNPRRVNKSVSSSKRGSAFTSGNKSDVRYSVRPGGRGTADGLIVEALSHLGYKPRPGGETTFGRRTGYSGHAIPWSGAFIDCVAYDSGTVIPACVSSVSGLAEFSRSRRTHLEPKPGDIVFFAFPTPGNPDFSMPHVGIVTDILDRDTFVSCEAQIESTIKAMTRHVNDAICFGRPEFGVRPGSGKSTDGHPSPPAIILARLKAGSYADIYNVQRALHETVGLRDYTPGTYDHPTKAAMARWQRRIGFVGNSARGMPDQQSLSRLGEETGTFSTEIKSE